MAAYEATGPSDESILEDELNYALRDQNLTLEKREELLNVKLKQIEIANQRNASKKNMLTVFIIINIVVVLVFVGLIVLKVTNSMKPTISV